MSFVYFVLNTKTDLVKIGYTMRPCPYPRVMSVTHKWYEPGVFIRNLRLLGVIPCDDPPATEKVIHAEFFQHHKGGEWFTPSDELYTYIQTQTRGHACHLCLPSITYKHLDQEADKWSALLLDPYNQP